MVILFTQQMSVCQKWGFRRKPSSTFLSTELLIADEATLGVKKPNSQGSSSPSRSMTSRVTVRSMASTSETSSAPATSTPPWRPSLSWAVRARRERRPSSSTTSTPSSRRPRTPRTPVASTTSLRSWSCTTRTRTAPSSRTSSSDCWPTSVIHSIISYYHQLGRRLILFISHNILYLIHWNHIN